MSILNVKRGRRRTPGSFLVNNLQENGGGNWPIAIIERSGLQGVKSMVCKKCGETVNADVKFCGKCGAAMNAECSSEQSGDTKVEKGEAAAESQSTPASIALNVIGILLFIVAVILYIVATIDFAGMYFNYDFTGVSWSPLAFSLAGGVCQLAGGVCQTISEKLEKYLNP